MFQYNQPIYRLTIKLVDDVDLFTNSIYQEALLNALVYCQNHKGLKVCAWVILSNRIELIATTSDKPTISDILRDLKKFTSKQFVNLLINSNDPRKDWLLYRFKFNAVYTKNKDFKVWTNGNSKRQIEVSELAFQKNEVHLLPVKKSIVVKAYHYIFSSAFTGNSKLIRPDTT